MQLNTALLVTNRGLCCYEHHYTSHSNHVTSSSVTHKQEFLALSTPMGLWMSSVPHHSSSPMNKTQRRDVTGTAGTHCILLCFAMVKNLTCTRLFQQTEAVP